MWKEGKLCISWYKDAINIQASAYIVSLTCELQTLNILPAHKLTSANSRSLAVWSVRSSAVLNAHFQTVQSAGSR